MQSTWQLFISRDKGRADEIMGKCRQTPAEAIGTD